MDKAERFAIMKRNKIEMRKARKEGNTETRMKTMNWDHCTDYFMGKPQGSGKKKKKYVKPTLFDISQKAKRGS
jgi:hypothetical protein